MSLTDARKMWRLLRDAGEDGVHSHTLRAKGVSGNPSQRAKDIVSKGQPVWTAREARNGRPGSRYWLRDFAPDWAVPVRANGADVDGEGTGASPNRAAVDVSATSSHGSAVESRVPSPPPEASPAEPLGWFRDYTNPRGEWELREAA